MKSSIAFVVVVIAWVWAVVLTHYVMGFEESLLVFTLGFFAIWTIFGVAMIVVLIKLKVIR